MTLFSIAVLILLFVRHRSNLARIWAGTERRVSFGRGPKAGSQAGCGKISVFSGRRARLAGAAALGGVWAYRQMNRRLETTAGPWNLRETDRTATGQQRVDRVVFARGGNRLAAICPRYDRLVIYDVKLDATLALTRDVQLEGRPVAIVTSGDHFIVLERPHGDDRHIEPGWWEVFDLDGNHRGSRNPAGFYPDDLAVSIDGRHLFVISSGQAEGDPKKPMPALETFELDLAAGSGRVRRRVEFDRRDDPARLALSASGRFAAVLLSKTNQIVGFDISVPESPHLVGRTRPSTAEVPYVSPSPDSDWIMMPVASPSEAIAIPSPLKRRHGSSNAAAESIPSPDFVVSARHRDSVIELVQNAPFRPLGRLPLTGPLNLGKTRPTGLAYSPERGLLAVSTRSGSIHLLELAWRNNQDRALLRAPIATAPDTPIRR